MLLAQTLEVRAMPLIVLPVSALLLLWAWAGAYVLLNPSSVDPAFRSAGLPMFLLFGGLFLGFRQRFDLQTNGHRLGNMGFLGADSTDDFDDFNVGSV